MSRSVRLEALTALYAAAAVGMESGGVVLNGKAKRLAEGAWGLREELDGEIGAVTPEWRIDRMPAVDVSILRLALYEMRNTGTPVAVVINEAVDIAKAYSTAKSGRFVNGVLAQLVESR